MGDRGNIKIGGVYLYTHWCGSKIKGILKNALSRRERWDDEPYLARIIFCEMVKEDIGGSIGFGICDCICDNDNPVLEVDVVNQEVMEWYCDRVTTEGSFVFKLTKKLNCWSFEEFIGVENEN